MELAQITAGQVVMLFLLIGTGIAAVKTGVLKPEGKQTLSNLLVYLVVPAMIVNSYRMEFSMEILHNLLAAFGMSLLALLSEDDRGSAYRVRELEGSVRQNGYTIPQMEISRKEQKA